MIQIILCLYVADFVVSDIFNIEQSHKFLVYKNLLLLKKYDFLF